MTEQDRSAHTPWTAEWIEESSDWVVMGCVYTPDEDGIAWQPNICTLSDSVSEDVARMIAAAPELLEALQYAVNSIAAMRPSFSQVKDEGHAYHDQVLDNARAAIAKATGDDQ